MNRLDQLIGWISPERGLMRARARAALQVVGAMERGYEGAKNSRRTSGWKANGTSANAEISPALSALRNRSRDQVRNNPYAKSAIAKLVARSIGTGIMARVPDSIKGPWAEFVKAADFEGQLDFYGLQSLVGRAVFESGECLVRRIRLPAKGDRIPLQIQVLEPDYIDTLKFGAVEGGNYVIAGIQIDSLGRRNGYWIYKQHPGENVFLPKTLQSEFVPASEILHVYEKDRPGQLRGVPRLAVALMKLRDLDDYEDAELVRKKIEACFAAFVSGGEGSLPLANSSTSSVTNPNSGNTDTVRTETLSPGMIEYLRTGETVDFGTPRNGSGYGDYTRTQLHAIAAGAGVTYEQLTGDHSQVTYLSGRVAQMELRELIGVFQWIYFIPMCCQGVYNWFLDAAYTAGRIRSPIQTVVWTPPRWQWIDPVKDTEAAKEEILGGLSTVSCKLREMGMDPEEVFKERADELKKMAELGISVDTNPDQPKVTKTIRENADVTAEEAEAAGRGEGALRMELASGAIQVHHPKRVAIRKTVTERDENGLVKSMIEEPVGG